jgi:hypothetical protein
MIPACCPQTWEHVGVVACAVKMLDVGGSGAGNPQLGRLTLPYGVRFEQTKLQMEALPPSKYNFSTSFTSTGRFLRQIRRMMSSMPSYRQIKFVGFQNPPHSRGASNPRTSGTRTPAPPTRSIISALYFVYSRRCPFHAP